MSRRLAPGPIGELIDRLARDPERLAAGIVVVGTALAASAVLLGGFVPTERLLVVLLYPLARVLPVLGVAIALGACWWAWHAVRPGATPLLEDDPPEAGVTRADHRVGEEPADLLEDAANEWYRCYPGDATPEVARRLAAGAVLRLTTRRGLEPAAAREAVREGTWTDDPVAAAFLAEDVPQPLDERLRTVVDPGAAVDRRVRRTLAAIEAIGAAGTTGTTETTGDARPSPGTAADRDASASTRLAAEPDAEVES